ncbi:MAG: alcohol dehydrogenase family protein [Pseudomonadota bacterium]
MAETMQAMVLMGHGDMDKLVWHEDWPKPVAGPGAVLIKVLACGLNNTDVNTRTAWYSKGVTDATTGGAFEGAGDEDATWGGASITFPRIQGADVAGRVEAVGEGVDASLVGKRVMIDTWLRDWNDPLNLDKAGYFGSECDGGYAAYTKADHRHVHPVDCDLSDAELASFATAYVTAENMLNRARVAEGDTVLIPGASGGVGSALIQLANRRGAKTVAMCSAAKADQVRAVGPHAILPREPEDLAGALEAAIGSREVTVVADVVGGAIWPNLIGVIARGGRYTCAGAIAGPIVEFDLRTFYLRDLTFTGATVVPPGTFADIVGYVERGEIKPLVAATYPLKDFHEAQNAFIAKAHTGNIVVIP